VLCRRRKSLESRSSLTRVIRYRIASRSRTRSFHQYARLAALPAEDYLTVAGGAFPILPNMNLRGFGLGKRRTAASATTAAEISCVAALTASRATAGAIATGGLSAGPTGAERAVFPRITGVRGTRCQKVRRLHRRRRQPECGR
jgi:hypothetical protein